MINRTLFKLFMEIYVSYNIIEFIKMYNESQR